MAAHRSYLRDDPYSSRPQGTSALTWLLAAIAAGFVLQNIFLRWFNAESVIDASLALTVANLTAARFGR